MRRSWIPWAYYNTFVKSTLWLVGGSKYGIDQWVGGVADDHYSTAGRECCTLSRQKGILLTYSTVIFMKSDKAIPYISLPYRSQSWLHKIRSCIAQTPIPNTNGRSIDLAPWPDHIDRDGIIHFVDNGRPEAKRMSQIKRKVDMLVMATGYTQKFPFLDATYPRPDEADLRRIWKQEDESVGFIGFVRPSFGICRPFDSGQQFLMLMTHTQALSLPWLSSKHSYGFWPYTIFFPTALSQMTTTGYTSAEKTVSNTAWITKTTRISSRWTWNLRPPFRTC